THTFPDIEVEQATACQAGDHIVAKVGLFEPGEEDHWLLALFGSLEGLAYFEHGVGLHYRIATVIDCHDLWALPATRSADANDLRLRITLPNLRHLHLQLIEGQRQGGHYCVSSHTRFQVRLSRSAGFCLSCVCK